MGPILGHTMHYRLMIITLQPGYSIPLLDREKNKRRILNNTAKHLYKTHIPSTRKGAVDRQVKSNPRNKLIHGRHRCGKGHIEWLSRCLMDGRCCKGFNNAVKCGVCLST